MITILIIFLLLNLLPAIYYGQKYFALKKKNASDKEFKQLSKSMIKSERIILPISILLMLLLYFIK
ncbi:hypothetical protein PZM39_11565 [Staphylococcus epidermidis]|uniref:hypothetical protein n=1 Tax=Staphylococcus epidermidis TaxID=1282 RepID=UPI000C7E77C1|nr:hypothetical protein [Staphylococcus epidermidis]MDI0074330.1 hypothetical protein [Staphylococcus epidermidis]PLA22496.1 hypothetical protein CYK06_10770 [Staphylococcus hominis]